MPMNQDYTPAQLTQLVDQLRDQVAQLARANATLVERTDKQAAEIWELRQSSGTVEVTTHLEASGPEPEVTISFDQLADGTWRYKTSTTMASADGPVIAAMLALVDKLARDEASRRTEQDVAEGRVFSKPKAK